MSSNMVAEQWFAGVAECARRAGVQPAELSVEQKDETEANKQQAASEREFVESAVMNSEKLPDTDRTSVLSILPGVFSDGDRYASQTREIAGVLKQLTDGTTADLNFADEVVDVSVVSTQSHLVERLDSCNWRGSQKRTEQPYPSHGGQVFVAAELVGERTAGMEDSLHVRQPRRHPHEADVPRRTTKTFGASGERTS